MTSMIELVAKRIYQGRNGFGCTSWFRLPQSHRDPYMMDARESLNAIRNPSDEMFGGQYGTEPRRLFTEMIDAALKEQP